MSAAASPDPSSRGADALARRHAARMARFGGAGLISAVTDFSVFALLVAAGAAPALANLGAFLVANLQSYWLNARLTFREGGRPAAMSAGGYGRFLGAHLLSLAVSTGIVFLLAPRIGAMPSKVAAMIVGGVLNYIVSAAFVFGGLARPKADSAERESP